MTDTTHSPFRRRGFIAATIIVVFIVIAAIVVLVSSITRGDNTSATPPMTPTTSTPSVSAAAASICGLSGFETSSSLNTAPNAHWVLVGTIAAPDDSGGAGPGLTATDGFRSCYSHTPEGALFAAVNYSAMSTDSRLAPEVTDKALVPGPGRDAAIAKQAQSTPNSGALRAQIAGFKIDSYTETQATIDLVLQVWSTGALVSIPTILQWSGGDWKGVTDSEGNSPLQPASIDNLGGYIPWSGA